MAYDIGPRIGLDGESEFRKQLNNINTELKTLGTEMQKVTSEFADNANGQEALISKNKVLNSSIDAQNKKLEAAKKALAEATKKFGEGSTEALKWQQVVNRSETELNKLETELKQNNEALDEMDKGLRDTESGMRDVAEAAEDAGRESSTFGDNLKASVIGHGIVEGIKSIASAISNIVEETKEYRKIMSSLDVSSEKAGYSAEETTQSYKTLYGVLADDQTAATTTANLQALGLNQEELTTLINGTIGAWASYGDSIPIDGLAEAINETAKVGTVTGTFADVLNWAGTSEDEFNERLAACSSQSERTNLIMQELANQGLMEAGKAWQDQNADLVAANQAAADFDSAMAEMSERVTPVSNAVHEGINKILEKLLELTENVDFSKVSAGIESAFTYLADTVVPKIIEFGTFLIDNKDIIIGAIEGVGLAFAAWKITKIGTGLLGVISGTTQLSTVLPGLTGGVSALSKAIAANPIGAVITLITLLITTFMHLWNTNEEFRNNVTALMADLKEKVSNVIESIKKFFSELGEKISSTFSSIKETVTGKVQEIKEGAVEGFKNMVSGIKTKVSEIKDSVVEGFENATDYITSLPGKAIEWGKDFIQGLIDGIKSKISGIKDAVKGVAGKIKSFLHFSVPDEGPLTSAPEWMPDMIKLMVSGIKKSQPELMKAIGSMAGNMQDTLSMDSGALTYSANINQPIYHTTIVKLDGKEIYKNAERYIGGKQRSRMAVIGK